MKRFINAIAPWWLPTLVLSGGAVVAGFAGGVWLLAGGGLLCMTGSGVLGIMVAVQDSLDG